MNESNRRTRPFSYRVYIIDLKKSVLDDRRFAEKNPAYIKGKPCVYVGSTGKPVEDRFVEHRSGYKSSRLAKKYGKRLRRDDMKKYRPRASSDSIKKKEQQVAEELRAKGWGVWWN